jgi:hypothetical protein
MEDKKALKNDDSFILKPMIDLIPSQAIWGMAQVFGYGANKYERGNYKNGIEWSRLYNACQRHLNLWNMGQDIDDESKLCHINHAMCNLAMLAWNIRNRPELDDRWEK